ncbi:MAG: hypothetical protein J4473_02840 [Candidatus Aenigmarchaeota archaeon]|nr:hypothetical protein [Candidatus Aenigmarchaeota archaeon]
MRLYHLVSKSVLDRIKEVGYLEPRTETNDDFHPGVFIVCGAAPDFNEWKEYGLFETLTRKVKRGSNGVVILSFPVSDENFYFREHAHISPKRFLELYGKDLWSIHMYGSDTAEIIGEEDYRNFQRQRDLYLSSWISGSEYDNSYSVPEVWYPDKVPLEKIKLEGMTAVG